MSPGANGRHPGEVILPFPESVSVTLGCQNSAFSLSDSSAQEASATDATEATKGGRHFEISDEEAWQLGLAVSEVIRHRWTGEFPDRVEEGNRATYREQTSVGPAFLLRAAEAVALREYRDPCPMPPDQDLYFFGFPRYKEWAVAELTWLSRRVAWAVSSPAGKDIIPEITEKAALWRRAYRKNQWSEAAGDLEMHEASKANLALCRPIINSTQLSASSKAELINALAITHRRYADMDTLEQELKKELESGDIGLCSLLLECSESGDHLVDAMEDTLPNIPIERLVCIADSALVPLARRLQRQSCSSITGANTEIEVLNGALSRLDSPFSNDRAKAVFCSHLPAVTRAVTKTFEDRSRVLKINRDHVPHYLAVEAMQLLNRLYFPKCHAEQQPPPSLGDFLTIVFKQKFDHYRYRREVVEVGPVFNKLASACGLDRCFRI